MCCTCVMTYIIHYITEPYSCLAVPCRCSSLDELIEPLRVHLVPKLADDFVIGILGGASKRLEAAIRKVRVDLIDLVIS